MKYLLPIALITTLASLPLAATAQYRWIDANGKITYGDAPPPKAKDIQRLGEPASGAAANTDPALPYELRMAMERFPVTLYTAAKCAPCDQARNFLHGRGVPYTEKTISHTEELALMKQKGLGTDLPAATVGRQSLRGFRADTWALELNAAGYPEQSRLPPNWKPTAAQPLLEPPQKSANKSANAPNEAAAADTDADNTRTQGQQTPDRPVRPPFRRVDTQQ